ncbi:STAS domain-containing protein [Streptomyces sp. NPDC001663]|uniref:STAS domain-containing protein n=1 Tax=Streptomyces sp. NPDC001663 TaxID=3364597 RepID=UPI0036C7624A
MAEKHTRPELCHTERVVGGATVVEVRGEIDILTASPLSARIDALTAGRRPDLVLDLRPMTFIDCSGLRVLCRARNRVLAHEGRLRLVNPDGHFLVMLRTTHLGGVFEIHPDVPTALFGDRNDDAVSVAAGLQ